MKKLFDLLKENLNVYTLILGALVAIATPIAKLFSLLKDIPVTKITVSIVIIILFFLFKNIFNNIIHPKKQNSDIINNLYSKREIRNAKIGRYLIWILLLIPFFFFISHVQSCVDTHNDCVKNRKKINLLIANFSKSTDSTDFSGNLYGALNERLEDVDTINVIPLNKCISDNPDYKNKIKDEFDNNCSDTGLLVFGKRNDAISTGSKLFYCRIASLNFFNKQTHTFETNNKIIIYIKNPDLLEFSIDYETKAISTFIFGLLYNRACDYQASNQYLDSAITLNKNDDNKIFIADCHLFKGDNLVSGKSYKDALNEYKKGQKYDPTNAYLCYNIASVYKQLGDTANAIDQYKKAKKINPSLKNPLIEKDILENANNHPLLNSPPSDTPATPPVGLKKKPVDTSVRNINNGKWVHEITIISNEKNKYGIVVNKKDTIARCIYKQIDRYLYKDVDYFIVEADNELFGAIIHKRVSDGYYLYTMAPGYEKSDINGAVTHWIDANNSLLK